MTLGLTSWLYQNSNDLKFFLKYFKKSLKFEIILVTEFKTFMLICLIFSARKMNILLLITSIPVMKLFTDSYASTFQKIPQGESEIVYTLSHSLAAFVKKK